MRDKDTIKIYIKKKYQEQLSSNLATKNYLSKNKNITKISYSHVTNGNLHLASSFNLPILTKILTSPSTGEVRE